jgi:benzoylformate decarboxylase
MFRRTAPDPAGIRALAERLLAASNPIIFCGDQVARAGAVSELVRLAERIGASVHGEILPVHSSFPNQHFCYSTRGAGDYAQIRDLTADADAILLVGGEFFEEVWYVDTAPFPAGAAVLQIDGAPSGLGRNHRLDVGLLGDPKLALAGLLAEIDARADDAFSAAAAGRCERLRARKESERASHRARVERTAGNRPLSTAKLMDELERAAPSGVAVSREAITAENDLNRAFSFEGAGDYLGSRGGGIGQGLPSAIGMKLAQPHRPVLCVSGDGSSLYTIQALWTAAHHRIPVVFVILNNRVYRILKYNMNRFRQVAGTAERGGYPHLDLTDPDLDYVSLARGFGLEAERIVEAEAIGPAVERAFASGEPRLLEVVVDGSV